MQGKLKLASEFAQSYPLQAARILEEQIPTHSSAFIDAVPDGQSIGILSTMQPYHAAKCIALMETEAAARYVSRIDPKSAANILRHIPTEQVQIILKSIPKRMSSRISLLMDYSSSMIGAWLQSNILTLVDDCSVNEAKIRLRNEQYSDFHRIYVVDSEQFLKGYVKLVSLVNADETNSLTDFIHPASGYLLATTAIDDVYNHPGWSESDYLPVVDRQKKFLGIVRFAGLRRAISQIQATAEATHVSKTILEFTETCHIALAETVSAFLAYDSPQNKARKTNDVR